MPYKLEQPLRVHEEINVQHADCDLRRHKVSMRKRENLQIVCRLIPYMLGLDPFGYTPHQLQRSVIGTHVEQPRGEGEEHST